MKFSTSMASIFLALIIMLTAVAPAEASYVAAKEFVKVEFQNKTGALVTLILTGPHSYYYYLNTGKTKVEIIPGNYTYSYTACGQSKTGKFNAKNDGANLTLPKCSEEKKSGESKVTFKNNSGASFYLTLTGPKTYSFYLSTGTTKMTILSGKYKYSYQACGQTKTGNFNAKGAANLVIAKCKEEKSGGGANITIKNNTGGSLYIYLTGPKSYTFYFSTGTSKIEIAAGKYSYTAYGCGGATISGTKNFKGKNDTWTFWCY